MDEMVRERKHMHQKKFVVREKFKVSIVTKLRDSQGPVIKEKRDLDKNCTKFYSKFYI
jgi:hypothetical protein